MGIAITLRSSLYQSPKVCQMGAVLGSQRADGTHLEQEGRIGGVLRARDGLGKSCQTNVGHV